MPDHELEIQEITVNVEPVDQEEARRKAERFARTMSIQPEHPSLPQWAWPLAILTLLTATLILAGAWIGFTICTWG